MSIRHGNEVSPNLVSSHETRINFENTHEVGSNEKGRAYGYFIKN
jgi:hypothetical protein